MAKAGEVGDVEVVSIGEAKTSAKAMRVAKTSMERHRSERPLQHSSLVRNGRTTWKTHKIRGENGAGCLASQQSLMQVYLYADKGTIPDKYSTRGSEQEEKIQDGCPPPATGHTAP